MTYLRLFVLLGMLSAPASATVAAVPNKQLDLPCTWPVDEPEKATPLCRAIYRLGRYDGARRGPVINGKPTIEATVQPEWGFDFIERSVALLQEDKGQVRVLWVHPSYYRSNFAPVGEYDETVMHWRYAPDGRTIRVTGTTAKGPLGLPGTPKWLKRRSLAAETYRYSERTHRFELLGRRMANTPTRASDQFKDIERAGKVVKSYDSGTGKAYRIVPR